jgi:hypothetical protein
MQQTQQEKIILQADRTSPEAEETESENIIEILLFIAFFCLLRKAPFQSLSVRYLSQDNTGVFK